VQVVDDDRHRRVAGELLEDRGECHRREPGLHDCFVVRDVRARQPAEHAVDRSPLGRRECGEHRVGDGAVEQTVQASPQQRHLGSREPGAQQCEAPLGEVFGGGQETCRLADAGVTDEVHGAAGPVRSNE
jgi:hypothetical protein